MFALMTGAPSLAAVARGGVCTSGSGKASQASSGVSLATIAFRWRMRSENG